MVFYPSNLGALSRQRFVLDTVWFDRGVSEPTFFVFLIGLKVTFKPFDVAIALKGQYVGYESVKEPTVVADDYGTASELI